MNRIVLGGFFPHTVLFPLKEKKRLENHFILMNRAKSEAAGLKGRAERRGENERGL